MTSSIGAGGIEATPPTSQQETAEQENLTEERIEQMTKSQEEESDLDVGFEKKDPGTEAGEAAEVKRATEEATSAPLAAVEKMEYAPAEDLIGALIEAVDAVPMKETPEVPADQSGESRDGGRPAEIQSDVDPKAAAEVQSVAAEVSTAIPTITLEGSSEAGRVTIDGAEVAEAAGDQGDVMIDTVPLPESPLEADNLEANGTWPTPEVPVQASSAGAEDLAGISAEGSVDQPEDRPLDPRTADPELVSEERSTADVILEGKPDPAAIIDSNDGISTKAIIDSNDGTSRNAPDGFSEMNDILNIESTSEIVEKLINNLPEGSDDLANQAATNIVSLVLHGESENYLTPAQDIIQENTINITSDQTDGFLAVSLIKAYQKIHTLSSESTDQDYSESFFGKGVVDDMKGKLNGMNDISEMTSLRLQMTMDRRSKFISTLSNIMKKISSTQDQLVQNIK